MTTKNKAVYDPQTSEPQWQANWEKLELFQNTASQKSVAEKLFLLFAFAYPSGSGLHVGHVESKTALDILARFHRMHGKQVFFPVGWDAFGLPAENYAIKTGIPPVKTTKDAINTFRRQIKRIGISYDWASEIATCHPEYYKWTQWIFLQLFKKGLAYRSTGMVNWCPQDQTVLANEQVVDGACERCGSKVIQKDLEQWFFKITKYQDELISGLDQVDWPEATKQHQLHWIGKSQGLSIHFTHDESGIRLPVWTKCWETVFGVTFVVISPERFKEWGLAQQVAPDRQSTVTAYLEAAARKTEEERQIGTKEKSGVDTGLMVKNPANGELVPLWIADYVLSGVGTGVVMGVPAHDERDFAFARKFQLPIRQVVEVADQDLNQAIKSGTKSAEGDGVLTNSDQFNGQEALGEGKQHIAEWLIKQGVAEWQTTYKLRDWLISRQRYWGAPIPIVYDPEGRAHPVKDEHLPWMLPTDVEFKPTGESPLVHSQEFIERTEKLYGKGWRPEFDTMDTFVDSSWYFMRYTDARNSQMFADPAKIKQWLPVDLYMIGPEHIVLHLLYARFFTKFLRDEGYLTFDEPFKKMRHQGMILGPDGKKMSKSKGNVINPDEVIEKFGADTLRIYEMFMGPLESDKPWNVNSVAGVYRFLQRVHRLVQSELDLKPAAPTEITAVRRKLHRTIQKVTDDIPKLKFNTAIASLMELVNDWEAQRAKQPSVQAFLPEEIEAFVKVIAPFAPFISEELSRVLYSSNPKPETTTPESVHLLEWPSYDPELAKSEVVIIPVQVNGKLRGQIEASVALLEDEKAILLEAKQLEKVKPWLANQTIIKEMYIPHKIVNLVVKPA